MEGSIRTIDIQKNYTPGILATVTCNLHMSTLENPPERYDHPRKCNISPTPHAAEFHTGVNRVGVISASLPPDFDFGRHSFSRYNSVSGRVVHIFAYQLRVIFRSRGSNLRFDIVVNGSVISTAVIDFDNGQSRV